MKTHRIHRDYRAGYPSALLGVALVMGGVALAWHIIDEYRANGGPQTRPTVYLSYPDETCREVTPPWSCDVFPVEYDTVWVSPQWMREAEND